MKCVIIIIIISLLKCGHSVFDGTNCRGMCDLCVTRLRERDWRGGFRESEPPPIHLSTCLHGTCRHWSDSWQVPYLLSRSQHVREGSSSVRSKRIKKSVVPLGGLPALLALHAISCDPNRPRQLPLSWPSVHCQLSSRRHCQYWLCKVSRQPFLYKYCSLPGYSLRRAANWKLAVPSTTSTQQDTCGTRNWWKSRRFNWISKLLRPGNYWW